MVAIDKIQSAIYAFSTGLFLLLAVLLFNRFTETNDPKYLPVLAFDCFMALFHAILLVGNQISAAIKE